MEAEHVSVPRFVLGVLFFEAGLEIYVTRYWHAVYQVPGIPVLEGNEGHYSSRRTPLPTSTPSTSAFDCIFSGNWLRGNRYRLSTHRPPFIVRIFLAKAKSRESFDCHRNIVMTFRWILIRMHSYFCWFRAWLCHEFRKHLYIYNIDVCICWIRDWWFRR